MGVQCSGSPLGCSSEVKLSELAGFDYRSKRVAVCPSVCLTSNSRDSEFGKPPKKWADRCQGLLHRVTGTRMRGVDVSHS